jgi:N-methylhydantoinase B
MKNIIDPILLEVMWSRLQSIVNEQASALIRASFTTIVRETEDLSCGIFTPKAEMVVQAVTGTPGHINTMASAVKHFVARYPRDRVEPGDVLISNNPWLCSGHRHDFTTVSPIFRNENLIGWTSTCCHAIDIGGIGFSADASEVFEEGLGLPILKLYKGGNPNQDVIDIIKDNVRLPKEVMGDIMAQISSQDICANQLCEFMERYQLDSLEPLAGEIFERSEKAMRDAIAKLPDGNDSQHEIYLDGFEAPIKLSARLIIKGDELTVDYSGTSPQIKKGINVPLNYTHAYTTYAVKTIISPEIPNNEGSFKPLKVSAPEGSILNAQPPAPVQVRHVVGQSCVMVVMGAFEKILPERTIGDGGSVYVAQWYGKTSKGRPFVNNYFANGGMGARLNKDGIHAFSFPTNVKNAPIEVVENISPLFFIKKEIREDTGGSGKFRGGCGQTFVVQVQSSYPTTVSPLCERTKFPSLGRIGGNDGRLGEFIMQDADGGETQLLPKTRYTFEPGSIMVMHLPGGGGYGPAAERDPNLVLDDVIKGYVSIESARDKYKVLIARDTAGKLAIDWQTTEKLRCG